MAGGRAYRVMVIEDQVAEEAVRAAFSHDASLRGDGEPFLAPLQHVARNAEDAIEQLEAMAELPDAILLDDYLPQGDISSGRAVELMSWLCRRCIAAELPAAEWPRAVLWTRADPQLAYTFCVLGGLQVRDKRDIGGEQIPVDAIWNALAGLRWQPRPFPTGLETERHRAPLPWMEAGWQKRAISLELASMGVTDDTMETTIERIRHMPKTPTEGPERPSTATMAVQAAKRNGWSGCHCTGTSTSRTERPCPWSSTPTHIESRCPQPDPYPTMSRPPETACRSPQISPRDCWPSDRRR